MAAELGAKDKCAKFIQAVAQGAFLIAAGVSDPSKLDAAGATIFSHLTAAEGVSAASSAGLIGRPDEDPRQGSTYTIARADFWAETITLYKAFFQKSPKGKAQTFLHEGIHLLFPVDDAQLAAAANVPSANSNIASANFQRELEKNCK